MIEPAHPISFGEAFRVWARIGLLSFGGPAGQIALMHRELVEERKWISESRFIHALNYCMLLPGPEAQQLAIYIGWLLHKTWGGIIAGVLFILPGAITILMLSALYAHFQHLPILSALFFGLKAAVLAIVVQALVRIGRRALKGGFRVAIAAVTFIAIFAFAIPFPFVIIGAAALGALAYSVRPALLPSSDLNIEATDDDSLIDRLFADGQLHHTQPKVTRTIRVLAICGTLWILPLLMIALWQGRESVFAREGQFFSEVAVFTFGGAYAALSYVAQRAVDDFMWLKPGEMLDGLALAETTPGPLILVLQFVAFLAAYHTPNAMPPMLSGTMGAAICLWATFAPCFLWIFVGAPYIESLRHLRILNAAMSAITAAAFGVILNLSLWFALHTFFGESHPVQLGPVHLTVPTFASLDSAALLLTLFALVATLRFKWTMPATLLSCAALGLLWKMIDW